VGSSPELRQVEAMSEAKRPDQLAMATAEDVLRHIYGDDFHGCTVSLETVASIIQPALDLKVAQDRELLELYERLVEAMNLLSTPPQTTAVGGPEELNTLIGKRLDTIRELVTKTIETTARFKSARARAAGQSD
jgi:hypothetical protein